jgi:hypothetical protein
VDEYLKMLGCVALSRVKHMTLNVKTLDTDLHYRRLAHFGLRKTKIMAELPAYGCTVQRQADWTESAS